MGRKTADLNMPIGKLTRVKDVLPPPDRLAMPKDAIKGTPALLPTAK